MKKLVLVVALLYLSIPSFAQYSIFDTVNFETPQAYVTIPNDSSAGQWQIGKPTKTIFTNALIGTKSIVTDTITPYLPGTKSIFYLTPLDLTTQIVNFTHSMNADSLHAGGYIEISYDYTNWYNLLDTAITNNFYSILGNWGDELFYATGSADITTLFNGKKGFTGNFTSKVYEFSWGFYPVLKAGFSGITMRFVFESDSLANPLDGWMIDDIELQADQLYSVSENLSRSISLYPNPAVDKLSIDIDAEKFKPVSYRITNTTGQLMADEKFTNKVINIATLPAGAYIITLTDAKGNSGAKTFYKQ